MKNKQIFKLLVLFVLFFSSFSNIYSASGVRPELNILIDASGSMGELIEGKSKMEIAKEAISTLVDSIPAETKVGLRAYGNQYPESAKNCTDTKVLVPISTLNKSEIEKQIAPLTPSGWTPIEYSLRQAYNDFSSSPETPRYIVLVSDGEETCGGDPCTAARDLEAKGIEVTINTIGFTVDQATKDQLTCIAQATGGNYYDANNTQELNNGLSEATKPVREFIAYTTEGEEIVGGSGFENPTQIYTDKQYIFEILNKENLFFFLNVPQNRRLTELSATVKTSDKCGISFRMESYGEDREQLSCSAGVGINPNKVGTATINTDCFYKEGYLMHYAYFEKEPHKGFYLTTNAKVLFCEDAVPITLKIATEPLERVSPTQGAPSPVVKTSPQIPFPTTIPLPDSKKTQSLLNKLPLFTALGSLIFLGIIALIVFIIYKKVTAKKPVESQASTQPSASPPTPPSPSLNQEIQPQTPASSNPQSGFATLVLVVLVVVLLALVGGMWYFRSQNQTIPTSLPDSIEQNIPRETTGKGGERAENMKIPIYPGSRKTEEIGVDPGVKAYIYAVKAEFEDVSNFYVDELKKLGADINREKVRQQIAFTPTFVLLTVDEANWIQIGTQKDENGEIGYQIVAPVSE